MKKLITFFTLSVFALPSSHAVLGPSFDSSQMAHSVCAIEFYSSTNRSGPTEEICSAVAIGENKLLTAAHCAIHLPERAHKIICRDNIETTITSASLNHDVDLSRLRFHESEHRLDSALIVAADKLEIPPLKIARSKSEMLELIDQANVCGVFGHGGFRHQMREQGLATSALILPEQIQLDQDLITINGRGGLNSGLVEPGDSGGSLACQTDNGDWVHIAQVSGRTMRAVSLFAPTYLLESQLADLGIFELIAGAPQYRDQARQWREEDLKKELSTCQDHFKTFTQREYMRNHSDLTQEITACREQTIEVARERLQKGKELKTRVATYSLVELDQREEMIELRLNRDVTRLIEGTNPFSTVDQEFNLFDIKVIEGDYARGELAIYGFSDYFGCTENTLCDAGTYKNVEIHIDDLVFSLPQ